MSCVLVHGGALVCGGMCRINSSVPVEQNGQGMAGRRGWGVAGAEAMIGQTGMVGWLTGEIEVLAEVAGGDGVVAEVSETAVGELLPKASWTRCKSGRLAGAHRP